MLTCFFFFNPNPVWPRLLQKKKPNEMQTVALKRRIILAGSCHKRAEEQGALGAREKAAAAGRGVQRGPGGHPARPEERAV